MPIFDYLCQCGKREERFLKPSNVSAPQYCDCGKLLEKQLTACNVYVMPSYQSPITGKWIDSPTQRKRDLQENNCRPWEGMEDEKKEAKKRESNFNDMLDKSAEKAANEAFSSLPYETQKILTKEQPV